MSILTDNIVDLLNKSKDNDKKNYIIVDPAGEAFQGSTEYTGGYLSDELYKILGLTGATHNIKIDPTNAVLNNNNDGNITKYGGLIHAIGPDIRVAKYANKYTETFWNDIGKTFDNIFKVANKIKNHTDMTLLLPLISTGVFGNINNSKDLLKEYLDKNFKKIVDEKKNFKEIIIHTYTDTEKKIIPNFINKKADEEGGAEGDEEGGAEGDEEVKAEVKVEAKEAEVELQKAKAEVNKAKAEVNKAKAEATEAAAEVKKATEEFKKNPKLKKAKADAEAELQKAEAKVNKAKTKATEAAAEVKKLESTLQITSDQKKEQTDFLNELKNKYQIDFIKWINKELDKNKIEEIYNKIKNNDNFEKIYDNINTFLKKVKIDNKDNIIDIIFDDKNIEKEINDLEILKNK
jgi:hypothetical protein